jgi:hypothetical protein
MVQKARSIEDGQTIVGQRTHPRIPQIRGHLSTSYQALAWFWCSVTSLRTSRALENVGIRWTSWTRGRTCDTVRYEKASLWWLSRR